MGKGVLGRGGGADDAGAAELEPRVMVGGGALDEAFGVAPRGCSVRELAWGVEMDTSSGILLSWPLCTRCALAIEMASRRLCWFCGLRSSST